MKTNLASTEAALLLACINVSSTPVEKNARIDRLLEQQVKWNRFTGLVMAHGMASMVCAQLKSKLGPHGVPSEVFAGLRYWDLSNSETTDRIATELSILMAEFEAAGIDALALKGPSLSQQAYGNLSSRNYADLDVLVRPSDVPVAAEVLISAGFRSHTYNREVFRSGFFRNTSDDFTSERRSAAVDLHWRTQEHFFPFGPDENTLWSRTESVRVKGHDVRTLGAGDHLLFVCAHASKHGWLHLGSVSDIAALVQARRELDLSALIEEATRLRFRHMVLLGLHLAHRLAGAVLPSEALRVIEHDHKVSKLTDQVSARLVSQLRAQSTLNSWLAAASTLDSGSDRLRMFLAHSFIPIADDYARWSLPHTLYPLYYAIRPLRLTCKAVRIIAEGP